jgi:hypothetical protein
VKEYLAARVPHGFRAIRGVLQGSAGYAMPEQDVDTIRAAFVLAPRGMLEVPSPGGLLTIRWFPAGVPLPSDEAISRVQIQEGGLS